MKTITSYKFPQSYLDNCFSLKMNHLDSIHWFDNDSFLTNFFNAMSCVFPEGGKFFMRSVKHFANEITDIQLKNDISEFIAQESFRNNAHIHFNKFLLNQNYPTDKLADLLKSLFKFVEKTCYQTFPQYMNRVPLALTCGLKHITTIMSHSILNDEYNFIYKTNDDYSFLWICQAIEELEHKSVAFDVYQSLQGSNYFERITAFLIVSIVFILIIHTFQFFFIYIEENTPLTLQFHMYGLLKLYHFNDGFIPRMFFLWTKYFHLNFHPSSIKDDHLISKWKSIIFHE